MSGVISSRSVLLYVFVLAVWHTVGVAYGISYEDRVTILNATFLYDSDAEWSPHLLLFPLYNSSYSAPLNVREVSRRVDGTDDSVLYRLEMSPQATVAYVSTASSNPVHVFLTSGKINTLRTATALASAFGPVPVASVYPFHDWHADGTKFSNGFFPRFGQEMKGRALVDVLIQRKHS